jgi:hypothetical protein
MASVKWRGARASACSEAGLNGGRQPSEKSPGQPDMIGQHNAAQRERSPCAACQFNRLPM